MEKSGLPVKGPLFLPAVDFELGPEGIKGGKGLILGGKDRVGNRPGDFEARIVPDYPHLVSWGVIVRALILHFRDRTQNAEPMKETWWGIKLTEILTRKDFPDPFPESGGIRPGVHGHVEDLTLSYPD